MQHTLLDFLRTALVPELGPNVAAGTSGHVELILVTVAAVRADPNELAVLFDNLDFSVVAADLAVVTLGVELGIHDVVVDELHDLEDCVNVVLHVRNLHIGDGSAGAQLLELGLQCELVKGIDFLSDMDMIGVCDVVLVGAPGMTPQRFWRHLANL